RRPVRDRRMLAAEDRIAAVGRADVVVVAVERGSGRADACHAGLGAVAHGPVGARGPVRHGAVLTAEDGGAPGGRARVRVVAVERRTRRARAGLARLRTVADGPVRARRVVRDGDVLAAEDRIAAVDRARLAVVAVEGRPGGAGPRLAGLGAVAEGAVRAGRAVRDRRVPAAE